MSKGKVSSLARLLLLGGILSQCSALAPNNSGLLCEPRPNDPTLSIAGDAIMTGIYVIWISVKT